MKRKFNSTKILKNNVFRRNVTKEIFLFGFLEKWDGHLFFLIFLEKIPIINQYYSINIFFWLTGDIKLLPHFIFLLCMPSIHIMKFEYVHQWKWSACSFVRVIISPTSTLDLVFAHFAWYTFWTFYAVCKNEEDWRCS